jgi:drug/metabolite transporter (DMT)-like permease
MIAAALVTQLAGYLAISYALGYLPASIVSPTLLGQPVLTALLAVPLLGEPITWAQVAGGTLVLAGIWVVNRPRQKE